MIIDTHVHLIRPFDSRGKPHIYSAGNPVSGEDYVALMDASGVDRAFFISWSPEDLPAELGHEGIDLENARETMSRQYALEVMQRFPDRFYWFPCHLGPALGDCVQTARDNLELGAAGLKLVCSFWAELPDDERLLPLYDLAEEYAAQIIIDTSYWYLGKDEPAAPETLGLGHRDVATRVRDFPDYLTHLESVIAAHPQVNFQLAHAGARSFTPEHAAEIGRFMRGYPNIYADLGALPTDSESLEVLVETAGADRVMFGTDWPHFAQGEAMTQALDHVRRPSRFTPSQAAMILGQNALRFVSEREPGLRPARGNT